ncbi:MAG TPA: PadR family transcriptional regulator [Candidatus Thermoplasmatota archaeon]|nr:PadR family transcriptional regulator [Candidatus Thermoplasmatota archaeon]
MGDATAKLMRGLLEPLILDAIAREPKHGYALIRELEQAFGEPPNRNQVYPLLSRLEEDGYLRADRTEGRGRTRYQLTGKGVELLKDYRLRTPLFRDRVGALWFADAPAPAPPSATAPPALQPSAPPTPAPVEPPPPAAAEPHLLDRLALAEEASRPAPPPPEVHAVPSAAVPRVEAVGHAGGPCTADLVLRRRASGAGVGFEVTGLDQECPTCQELLAEMRALRDRWF